MNTGLHESISLANSPCNGVCSTSMAPFDDICQGCGRNVEEIRDWETFPDFKKKIINVTNWLKGYEIKQKEDKMSFMSIDSKQKIKDIQGRLITIQSLIEMVGKDMLDEFGQDPAIKDSYQALFNSRESILKSKENFPQDL
jgi:predicted Fe-S protein YdhL (DUF1289 family)